MQFLTTACLVTFLIFLGYRSARKGSHMHLCLFINVIFGLITIVAVSALMLIGVIQ